MTRPPRLTRRATLLGLAALASRPGIGHPRAAPPRTALAPATRAPVDDWGPVDASVRGQVDAGRLPGAVLVVGDADGPWLRRAWGERAVAPAREAMTVDTVFDLASVTKAVCTTPLVLQLAAAGRLSLDAPAARYWPAFGANGKAGITVAQLLAHTSGLRPGLPLRPGDRPARVIARLCAERPVRAPGTAHVYSDLNFVALGVLVARVARRPLDRAFARRVAEPLGLRDTGFRPSVRGFGPRLAPTEFQHGRWLRGTVHDPTARALGGVSGNAGLFGPADDLARFARALLAGGARSPVPPAMLAEMRRRHSPADEPDWHGLGWPLEPPLVAGRETLPPRGAIGHTGYTGTGLWIDFVTRRFVVLLASRLQLPHGDARPLRRQVLALVSSLHPPLAPEAVAAIDPDDPAPRPAPRPGDGPPVATGIDVLREEGFAQLRGRRVGLLTHLAAIDRHGWRTLDLLRHAPGVTLRRLFSPEHGLYAQAEGRIGDAREPFSGLPVTSLYGGTTAMRPTMLADVDTLVVDLQDAGLRYYTYLATLGECLRAAAPAGVRVVVLDRPDPIGADVAAGPLRDAGPRALTGWARVPVRHGMTFGELARYLQADLADSEGLSVSLEVVPLRGYRRAMRFADTGLDWVPPSPNLRTPEGALLYAGTAWAEGTPVSVGRGTDRPFGLVGAPWIDGTRLAADVADAAVPGLALASADFTPDAPPQQGETCHGVALSVTDRATFDPVRLGAALLRALDAQSPGRLDLARIAEMVGSGRAVADIVGDDDLDVLARRWQAEAEASGFAARREAALLYR